MSTIEAPIAGRSRALRSNPFGALAPLALLAGVGLLMVALGNNAAREEAGGAQILFWGGLLLIYAPITLRLFSPSASRRECMALAVLLGAALFIVKVLYNPTGFIPHDEMATLRQTWELLETGHFFSDNPVVQGYAGYPGLEAVTAALSQISEKSLFVAGMIVLGSSRVMLMLALFLFLERVGGSHRVAAIGVAVYACNPSFLYFDSQFAYESLALPIGATLLLVSLRWSDAEPLERSLNRSGLIAAMAVLAASLVTIHHLTAYAMFFFLLTWALLVQVGRRSAVNAHFPATRARDPSRLAGFRWFDGPALPALFVLVAGALWLIFVAGDVTSTELGSVFKDAFTSVTDLISGNSGTKTIFGAGHGETNTTAARLLGVASIIPLLVVIPFGLRRTWVRGDSSAVWRALAVVALLYPVTLGLRLTQAGTETSQRASEFVFVGLAFVGGLLITELPPRNLGRRAARLIALAAIATIVFIGGFIVGESPITRQPGPYLVAGESRSLSPEGLAAAQFADNHLPPHSRILVDRVNGTLLAGLGHLDPVIGSVNGIPVSRVFFSRTYESRDQEVISEDAIDYIVVDRRFIDVPPSSDFYYEPGEPSGGNPVSREALQKFAALDGLDRIYDNGAIAIYDTTHLRSRRKP
ncbi:MAG TPA: hypothetical protein VHR18_12645 [Solirubrobacterales bacterium]|nr:hypothetical protein [Solirubrobacterales bacterium]